MKQFFKFLLFLFVCTIIASFILLYSKTESYWVWNFYYFFYSIAIWELFLKQATEELLNINFSNKLKVVFLVTVKDKKVSIRKK
jgi:hypothetical protein